MAKQATITEIAKRAGVSIGTVDRVLHNRSGVSKKSREKIQAILDEVGYKINLHTSAVALRKEYRIVISVPEASEGEYWDSLLKGISQAMEEYSDIHIICDTLAYDQFDPASCREAFSKVAGLNPDAVIIGPTFDRETHDLCSKLDENGVPYIFVDTTFPDTNPLAAFTADQPAGGSIIGSLLCSMVGKDDRIALILSKSGEHVKAQNAEQRRQGLLQYMAQTSSSGRLIEVELDLGSPSSTHGQLASLFGSHPEIKGVCILNSRGHIVGEFLRNEGIPNIKVVAFDLTDRNIRCLEDGSIFALICQRPERQGFLAVTTLLEYLLYRRKSLNPHILMPLDIVLRENLPYYQTTDPGV